MDKGAESPRPLDEAMGMAWYGLAVLVVGARGPAGARDVRDPRIRQGRDLLPETGRPAGILNTRIVLRDYRSLLGSPSFVGFVTGGGCATTAFYAFIASAPFIWAYALHRRPREVGFYLGLLIVGMSVGNICSNRFGRHLSTNRVMMGAAGVSVAFSFVLLAPVMINILSGPLIGSVMFVYSIGAGMGSPAVMVKSLSVKPLVTGSAAGLYGFIHMAVGAICTSLAALGSNATLSAAMIMAGTGLLGFLAFVIALFHERSTKRKEPHESIGRC